MQREKGRYIERDGESGRATSYVEEPREREAQAETDEGQQVTAVQ